MKTRYKKKYCKGLIIHMAKGMSYLSWGATIDPNPIGKSTMYDWESSHPDWAAAKEIGYQKGLLFFESMLSSNAMGIMPEQLKKLKSDGINLQAVMFALRTRFHEEYSERQKVEHAVDDGSINVHFKKSKHKEDK